MRRKILHVSAGALAGMFQGHDMSEVRTDFPPDGRIVLAVWDERISELRLVIESETFEDVPEGFFLPDMEVMITSRVSEFDALIRLVTRDQQPS